jgi:hypothetical protein
MLLIVPAGVLEDVLMVKVDCTDPFDGTVTVDGDHEPLIPVSCQLIAPGVTVPVKPPTLLKVTTKLVDEPCCTVWLVVLTEAPKSPVPA